MNIVTTPDSVLQIATAAMARTPDERLRTVMTALTRHLHAFVQEVRLTEEEFEQALEFIVGIGQATGEKKNEVVLAADLLGVSTLVALQNNQDPQGESPAALLGPFWRANAPLCRAGESIARSSTPGVPLDVRGVVRDAQGRPIAGAIVDAWQASPVGPVREPGPGAGRHEPARPLRDRCRRPLPLPHGASRRLPGADRRALRRRCCARSSAIPTGRRTCTSWSASRATRC